MLAAVIDSNYLGEAGAIVGRLLAMRGLPRS
jgi:hypothetical protein